MADEGGLPDTGRASNVPFRPYGEDWPDRGSGVGASLSGRLPVIVLSVLAVGGGVLAYSAERYELGESVREIGGAIVSGAIVGAALLWFEERLEARRDAKDFALAEQQERRDEQTTLLQQLSSHDDLSGIQMPWYDLHNAFLNKKNLSGAYLKGTDLRNSSITSSDISNAFLVDAILTNTRLINSDLSGANLEGADLRGAKLIRANLSSAVLTGADLRGCSLRRANLSGADLTDANLFAARLDDADLSTTMLDDALLDGVAYSSETIWPPGFEPPPSTPIRPDGDFRLE